VLPFTSRFVAADHNVGNLYVLAITSVTVVGVLMSGWASNSKWALFGGMRSAAQLVSYEIPSGMALLPGVLLAGTMSTQGIIAAQTGPADAPWWLAGGMPWNWYIFHSPMMLVLFFVFFIAQLAEGARIPFDLPEGESELVSGYNTEYSGFRFGAYFTAEFANTWIAAGLGVVVFLGGWQVPGVSPETLAAASGGHLVLLEALCLLVLIAKMAALVFVIIHLRWTLPRVRIDQLMSICWKYLLPITFVALFLILGWMILWPWNSLGSLIWRFVTFAGAGALFLAYLWRVRYNIVSAKEQPYLRWLI
jgi:NADH-quinone oxidoreductase subunit H